MNISKLVLPFGEVDDADQINMFLFIIFNVELLSIGRNSKLYRFDKDGNQWKERGVGTVKLLKHKVTGKVRLVMRQNKTLKICANHLDSCDLIAPYNVCTRASGQRQVVCVSVWHAADFSDGELKEETFCIRFASVESPTTVKVRVTGLAPGNHGFHLGSRGPPSLPSPVSKAPGLSAETKIEFFNNSSHINSYTKSFQKIKKIAMPTET
ncbi:hypothetical protein ACS0TY_005317 [Phlomoides rotata]